MPAAGIGLCGDPCEVAGVAVDDRPGGHAGDLVGMLALGAGNDLGYPLPGGVQRYPALGPLVHLARPAVDRPPRGDVGRAGGPALFGRRAGELIEPARVRVR